VFREDEQVKDFTRRAARAALAVKKTIESASDGAVRVRAALDSGEVIVRADAGSGGVRKTFNGAPLRVARRLVQCLNQGIIAATSRAQATLGMSDRLEVLDPAVCPLFSRDQLVYRVIEEVDT
jgi:class 3 adenylate cyclase